MWRCEESAEVAAPAQDAWSAWTDIEVIARAPDLRSASLDGPFAVGSRLTMKPEGMATARLRITRVDPPHVWTDEARGPGFRMTFDHVVEPIGDRVRLTERVEVSGLLSALLGRLLGAKLRAAARASVDHVASELRQP